MISSRVLYLTVPARLLLGSSVCLNLALAPSLAQPITPANDGTGTQVQQQGEQFNISGGTQSGANQFHSFERFGLDQQQTANFQTEAGTANVLGRVTGGDPSVINGTVRVTGSEANLYLMNPAGMVFGENARLDVPGSFHGTTADSIGFENGEFSATGQNTYQNLNSAPNRFNFGAGSNGAIVNQGDLAVNQGKNLSLTGSTVINTGRLTAPGGQAAVVAAPTGQGSQSVRITQNGMVMGLEVGADRLSQQNLSPGDLTQNSTNLPKVLTGGTVDHATDLRVVDGRVYLSGSGMAIDPLTGTAVAAGSVNVSRPDAVVQGGQVLVQGDRVQVLDARISAQGNQSQVQIQGRSAAIVQSSQLNLSNLVGIGGLLKLQGPAVTVRDSAIAANGSQGGGLVQIQASQGLAQLERSAIAVMSSQGTGGRVEVLGDRVEVLASAIDVSGVAGGEIYVGGDYQGGEALQAAQETFVDAGSSLDAEGLGWSPAGSPLPPSELPNAVGGRVIVWADDRTRFYGVLKAKGAAEFSDSGFAEVSGQQFLDLGQDWDQRISVGELLLDPTNITIETGTGGSIAGSPTGATPLGATTIANYLNNNGDLIITTSGSGTDNSDITVTSSISWSSDSSLTLRADRSVIVNSGVSITATGTGSITLEGNLGDTGTGNFKGVLLNGGHLSTTSGAIILRGIGGTTGGGEGVSGNHGIAQRNGSQVTTYSGDITYIGTGGTDSSADNDGMRIHDVGTLIQSHDGNIMLTGVTRSTFGSANDGILLVNSKVETTGSGTITLDGSSTAGKTGDTGVLLVGATIETTASDISITARTPAPDLTGIQFFGANTVGSSTGNNVTLLADTIRFDTTVVEGTGTVTVAPITPGIDFTVSFSILSNAFTEVVLGSLETGLTTVSGTTNLNAPTTLLGGSINFSGSITSNGNNVTLQAQQDLTLGSSSSIDGGTGNITLIGNTIALNSSNILGQGLLTISSNDPASDIGLGNNVPGTLNLTATELNKVADTFSRIDIGRTDGTGAIRVGQGINLTVAALINLLGGSDLGAGDSDGNLWTLTSPNSGTINGVRFQNFTTLLGGALGDSLQGTTGNDAFQITGANQITVGSMTFTSVESIDGSDGDDTITLAGGSLSGSIDGGAGSDTFTAQAATTFTVTGANSGTLIETGAVTATGFSNIENLVGSAQNDSFTLMGGSLTGSIDGGGGTNRLTTGNVATTVVLTGTDSGTITGVDGGFVSIQNLTTGAQNDSFILNGNLLTGSIDGGGGTNRLTVNDEVNTFVITGLDTGTVTGVGGGFTGIGSVTGGALADRFILQGGTLSGAIDGGAGTNSLTADNVATAFVLTGADSGTATGVGAGFSGIQNLTGGSGNDSFTLAGGTLTGLIDGAAGINHLTADAIDSAFILTGTDSGTVTGVAGGFSGIQNLTGGSGNDSFSLSGGTLTGAIDGGSGNNTLMADNVATTFEITGINQGTVSGLGAGFTNVGSLTGGSSTDTFQWITGSLSGSIDGGSGTNHLILPNQATTIAITGPNSGTVMGLGQGFQNLTDITANAQADTFQFGVAGSLAGTIDGGLGRNLLIADDGGVLIDISGTDAGTYTGKVAAWRNIQNIQGGAGNDTFLLSANTLTGTLDGGGGSDTIVGDTVANEFVVLTANGGTVTGVLGGFSNIENLTGNRLNDRFLVASTGSLAGLIDGAGGLDTLQSGDGGVDFIINGPDAGTLVSFINGFVRVENLVGGSGNDIFTLEGGSLSGFIDGGPGLDFLFGGDSPNIRLETPLLFAQLFSPLEGEAPIGLYDVMPSGGDAQVAEVSEVNQNQVLAYNPADFGRDSPPIATNPPSSANPAAAAVPNPSNNGNAAAANAPDRGTTAGAGGANTGPRAGAGAGAGAGAEAAGNVAPPSGAGNAVLPDPTTATAGNAASNAPSNSSSNSDSDLPDPNANSAADSPNPEEAPDPTAVASAGGASGEIAGGEGSGNGLGIAAGVVAGLAALGGAAAIATGAASTAAKTASQAAQNLAQGLQNLVSGGSAGGAGSPGLPLAAVAAAAGASQAQQYLAQLNIALEPRVESPLSLSIKKDEGASLTGGAMEISDQAIWAESDLETATAGLPDLGELMGVESSGFAIEAEEAEKVKVEPELEVKTAISAQVELEAGQQGRVEAVKAKIAEAAAKAGIPEDAVDAIYAVAIEKIGEILSEIDFAGGILGEAWSKALEIVEYRALLDHIQAGGAVMIPLLSHEVLAEQSPSIDLKFQETPVGTFGVDLSLGLTLNSVTLAMEGGKITHIHLGSLGLVGGVEFAGLPLFEAPDAALDINRIIRLGDGIAIKVPG